MPTDPRPPADDLGPAGHVPLPGQMELFFTLSADGPTRSRRPQPRGRPSAERRAPNRGQAETGAVLTRADNSS